RAWLQAVLDRLTALDPAALSEGSELRDLWKAAVETKAPQAWPGKPATTTGIPAAVAVALPLVKEFEGCKLTAYPDPETGAEPWTIGWGSTSYDNGAAVKRGDQISQDLADALLAGRLKRDCQLLAQRIPGWAELNANQQAALLSFTYNCGPNWYGSQGFSTLTRRLKSRELAQVPAALMLYVNPGGPSEAGLRRRRKAEAALFVGKVAEQPAARPVNFGNPLQVPWYAQMDSADRSQAARMCFSSSCAMLLQYLKPGALKGPNGDDQYLKRVQQYGDTTDAAAQIRALSAFGIKAQFVQNADFGLIERQVAAGVPVPCGFIHRGPVDRPTGGGHWLIVVGHDSTHLVVHDPFGEADLVSGRTLGGVGRFMRYSRGNFGKRWMVEPAGGAYRHAPGKGWAIIAQRP
ncbi:MAG: glycoside hydrolase family protein, partial [Cyanobacteriota bacterium]|nr:glycoside hydrolase family protein [Cyanobacteriota bacterium]